MIAISLVPLVARLYTVPLEETYPPKRLKVSDIVLNSNNN
jgi:hypothetical protein